MAANMTPEEASNSVISWPQYLSYESAESMPTGREASTPGALMRGVFVAHANGSVILDLYDPRAPLDSEEVQDSLPELYRCVSVRRCTHSILCSWCCHGANMIGIAPNCGNEKLPFEAQKRKRMILHTVV
jgi:hypothetical protein